MTYNDNDRSVRLLIAELCDALYDCAEDLAYELDRRAAPREHYRPVERARAIVALLVGVPPDEPDE